jgi:cytochrome oxidase Cu insertion factor (SCO1/SenC/PrrC family)
MTLRLPEQPVANRAAAAAAPDQIRNAAVYDQNGQKLFFFEDLIKGKTVVINFIFTTCTTICPPLAANMRQIEKELGQRAGRDVWLVSVSVDPVVDVPERLKAFGAKFGAGPGWTFVTGSKQEIDLLLKSLGAYVSDRNDHSPTTLIINEPAGYWTRAYGLATPSKIVAAIDEAAKKSRR